LKLTCYLRFDLNSAELAWTTSHDFKFGKFENTTPNREF
jgi:hypothetical protein